MKRYLKNINTINNIKELYVDYSKINKAIRMDILIENNVLIMIRHIFDNDKDDIISYSISVGKNVMEINWCDIEEINNRINENKEKYNW